MDLNSKLAVLNQIYRVYDEFVARLHTACKKYCAGCCTRNVTLTTLEGYLIATHMISYGKSSLFENIDKEDLIDQALIAITYSWLLSFFSNYLNSLIIAKKAMKLFGCFSIMMASTIRINSLIRQVMIAISSPYGQN